MIRPQLACLTSSNTHKSHTSTVGDDLIDKTSFYQFECGLLNLSYHQITAFLEDHTRQLRKHSVQMQSHHYSGAVLALTWRCWKVQLYISFSFSDCAFSPIHVGSFTTLQYFLGTTWWWAAHIATAWGTLPPSICKHISSGTRNGSVSWDVQYRITKAKTSYPSQMGAFVSIVIVRYLLVHAPADLFSTNG